MSFRADDRGRAWEIYSRVRRVKTSYLATRYRLADRIPQLGNKVILEGLHSGETKILEMIARGRPLPDVLPHSTVRVQRQVGWSADFSVYRTLRNGGIYEATGD
jgi:hypothetical protein